MRRTLLLITLIAGFMPWPHQTEAEAATPPNVVIIVADDQRADAIGDMPQLQSLLGDQGTTYANGMVPTSLCCPSRSTILRGEYAHTTGVWGNGTSNGGWRAFRANGGERSNLATWLHDAGYETGLIGKYLNDYDESARNYVPKGWNEWFAMREAAYYDYNVVHNGQTTHYGENVDDYSTDVVSRAASDFIRSVPIDRPLFAYVAPYATHPPFTPAPRDIGACADDHPWHLGAPVTFDQLPRHATSWMSKLRPWSNKKIRSIDRQHRDACETRLALDDLVGNVVDALATTQRLDNTLIIYVGDNGFLWGEHRLYGKSMPYDAATHVPLLMRMDGVIPANFTDGRMALNVDIASTIEGATGLSFPDLEGRDLLNSNPREGFVLEAMAKTDGNDRPAYCGWRTNWAFYVKYANGDAELYDYTTNLNEANNVVGVDRYHDLVTQLRSRAKVACRPLPPGFHW